MQIQKLHFSITINAPKEKVWEVMLGEDTYPLWTDVFTPGSYFVGDWSEGSKIYFIAPDESGKMSGTVFQIKVNKPYEFVSMENIGMVQDGKEDTSSKEARVYAGARENYTLKERDGATEVLIDLFPVMEIPDDYKEMYHDMWHKALQKLKELIEKWRGGVMEDMHFSIVIDAPKEKVWEVMLGEGTYPLWADVFMHGSYFVGDWSEGSKMAFLAPDENNNLFGILGKVKENRTNEFVSIEYFGVVEEGKEDVSSEEVKEWVGAKENYTLNEKDGVTEVLVDVDVIDEYVEAMQEAWPKALQKLKELAEKTNK